MTLMKLVAIAMAFSLSANMSAQAGSLYKVSVSVNKTEADGGKWDGFGPFSDPDIVVCLSERHRQTCLGKINGDLDYVNSDCEDELGCTFTSSVYISGDSIDVRVYDEDTGPDDSVGIGTCNVPTTSCAIGLGLVSIQQGGE